MNKSRQQKRAEKFAKSFAQMDKVIPRKSRRQLAKQALRINSNEKNS